MNFNKKSIFALGIFICFLICISHVSAYEGVDNSTSVDSAVDNSLSDYNLNPSEVLSVSNSDFANINQDKKLSLMNDDLSHGKLGKHDDKKKEVEDNITVGNFSLLNKELSDFNDNRYYRIIDDGNGYTNRFFDLSLLNQVQTFNLTRDYMYDDSTDKDFINGITLLTSAKDIQYNNIIINGNGHFIDGNGLACMFKVYGSNVQILNVTFRNLSTIHSYYNEEQFGSKYPSLGFDNIRAPIMWIGNNGKLINCTLTDNTGSFGGSLYWRGNEGIIDHNKFINNRAAFLGGFAYIEGKHNYIQDNLVFNCKAMLDGDTLYVKDIISNRLGQKNIKVVDGSQINVRESALHTHYVSLDDQCVDITPLVYYGCLYGRNYFNVHNYFELDNDVNVFASYDDIENVLTLTLSKFCTPTIEMRKTLNIRIYENDLSKTFEQLSSMNSTVVTVTLNDTIVTAENMELKVGENGTITYTTNPTGLNVTFLADDSGVVSVSDDGVVTALKCGVAKITIYVGDDKEYAINSTEITVTVNKFDTILTVDDVKTVYNTTCFVVATLTDVNGIVLTGIKVKINVGNITVIAKTDENGQVSMDVSDLAPGVYKVSARSGVNDLYKETKAYAKVVVSEDKLDTTLTVPDVYVISNSSAIVVATLKDSEGKAISGINVKIVVGDLTVTAKTDAKGQVSLDISSLAPGQYKISTRSSGVSDIYKEAKATAKAIVSEDKLDTTLTVPDVFVIGNSSGTVVATLKDSYGNLISGINVKLAIGDLTVTAKTDENGQVSLNISDLAPGVYKVSARSSGANDIYKETKAYAKVIVSEDKLDTTLTVPDVVVDGYSSDVVVATLKDSYNYRVRGVNVKITVGDLTVTAKTDENGQVSLNISSLAPGQYKVTARSSGVSDIYNESKATAKATVEANYLMLGEYIIISS